MVSETARTRVRNTIETNRDFPSYFHSEKYESNGYQAHLHRTVEIYCVVKGSSHVTVNEREYDLSAGQAVVINGMQIHSYRNSPETVVCFLLIGSNYMQLFASAYPDRALPEFLSDANANEPIFKLVNDIAGKRNDFDVFEAMGYANLLIHCIVKAYGTEPAKKASGKFVFSEIIQYIYDHYQDDLSLKSLADEFGYAPRSLGHMFGKYVKMDIRNFINGVRAEKVLAMRADPANRNKTLLELALACGFNSASSFYRIYRKNYGTPHESD